MTINFWGKDDPAYEKVQGHSPTFFGVFPGPLDSGWSPDTFIHLMRRGMMEMHQNGVVWR